MKKTIKIVLIIFVPLILLYFLIIGKEVSYKKLKMSKRNPTSYVFSRGLDEVKKVIYDSKKDFDGALNGEAYSIYSIAYDSSSLESMTYLIKEENKNDFVYHAYYGFSKLYISDDYPVRYFANFHIHVISIGQNKTLVTIFTLNPEIIVRVNSIIKHSPGFFNKYKAQPTTIEEYEILLVIGKKLGCREEMPDIIYPKYE